MPDNSAFATGEKWTDEATAAIGGLSAVEELAAWLVQKMQDRRSVDRTHAELITRFKLSADVARLAQDRACDGVIRAISGKPGNRPDAKTDPVAHATFELVCNTFNQNSFFARQRTPSRQWLDWYRDHQALGRSRTEPR